MFPLCVEKEFDFSPLYEMENLEAVDCGAESLAGAPRVNKFFCGLHENETY